MVPRRSQSAYWDTLAKENAAKYGGGAQAAGAANAPTTSRSSSGGYVLTSSLVRSPGGETTTSGVERTYYAPQANQTSTKNNAFSPPAGSRITNGAGNSVSQPAVQPIAQNAYAQALAGGGGLENPFTEQYNYLQSLMSGTPNGAGGDGWYYDPETEAYTMYPKTKNSVTNAAPTNSAEETTLPGGYADTVQGNANKITYNPVNAAQWNYDVPETLRMQSGGQLSPAAEAYRGMVEAATSEADIAMAQYWADIAANTTNENDRQYALRQALRYRKRIVV